MEFAGIQRALVHTYKDVVRHHALQVAAALAYYLVLSAIPCVIFLSAVVGFIPIPNLFGHIMSLDRASAPCRHNAGRVSDCE